MHHVLGRQIRKVWGETLPASPELAAFLRIVSDTYDDYDRDRELLERSFDISSKEFLELNNRVLTLLQELRIEKEGVEQRIIERTKELTTANERLRELDKVKTEFISVAAHQLRTPLSAVKWTLSLLIDEHAENLTSQQKSLLMKGYESNERTINLINKMLVVTRIESGKMQYELQQIHIEDLIDTVLLDFVGEVETRHATLSFKRPIEQLPYIEADPEKIRAVIQNFVENALYYTGTGGVVTVSAVQDGDSIRVSVEDNGIGIPAGQQLGIFNKFFRADNAAKVKTDGSGLGLFVAKNIIDRHGGTIGFHSKEHVGTTFYFTLPTLPHAAGGT
ncbi:HAMP domain-containing histidine kinase [Candidatus Kaiserbacteria bacterium]|nr:HAMP domain-containing histidine kinase [Candidatus Kaiserbacteria bacterium]